MAMGIKCSLLGHDFGEAAVERDRQEQGSEVVITIREVETCSRCGDDRVVSENKEVTSLETPEDVDAPVETAAAAAASEGEGDEPDLTAGGDDAEVVESEPGGGDETTPGTGGADEAHAASDDPGAEGTAAGGVAVTGEADPEKEDAEILDDEPDREPGEWPQESNEGDEAEAEFDQFEYSDPESDPPVEDEDAELIDVEDDTDRQTNAWPSEDEAGVDPDPTSPGAITVPEGTFVCEGCGFSTPVAESSLREGDFCPECHGETLIQVTDDHS
jgi:hypothetical protein